MKKRFSLIFDTEDQNSLILYCTLKKIKRGQRMEVLADNILSQLEEHKLMNMYGDDPAAMARALTMFSENFRDNGRVRISLPNIPDWNTGDGCRVTTSDSISNSRRTSTKRNIFTDAAVDKNISENAATCSADDKGLPSIATLNKEEYEALAVEIAKEYIFSKIDHVEQRQLMMQWVYMDPDELYEELVVDQLWFESQPENLPEGYSSMLEYVEHEIAIKGFTLV